MFKLRINSKISFDNYLNNEEKITINNYRDYLDNNPRRMILNLMDNSDSETSTLDRMDFNDSQFSLYSGI
jgi:hypothetical protein